VREERTGELLSLTSSYEILKPFSKTALVEIWNQMLDGPLLCSSTAALVFLLSVDCMDFCWNADHIMTPTLMQKGFIMIIPEPDRVFKKFPKENRKLPKSSGHL